MPRGDGIIVLECVQLEEHSRTAAAAGGVDAVIRCHGFGANIKAVRSIPKASADATYGAILLIGRSGSLRRWRGRRCAPARAYLRDLGRCAGGSCPSHGRHEARAPRGARQCRPRAAAIKNAGGGGVAHQGAIMAMSPWTYGRDKADGGEWRYQT